MTAEKENTEPKTKRRSRSVKRGNTCSPAIAAAALADKARRLTELLPRRGIGKRDAGNIYRGCGVYVAPHSKEWPTEEQIPAEADRCAILAEFNEAISRAETRDEEQAEADHAEQAEADRAEQAEADRRASLSADEIQAERAQKIQADRAEANAAGQAFLLSGSDIAADDSLSDNVPWIIEGILPDQSYSIWYGEPKSFKSFTALDIALTVAAGLPDWCGHAAYGAYPVLYLDYENRQSIRPRIAAWCEGKNYGAFPEEFFVYANSDTIPLPIIGTDRFERLIGQMKAISNVWDLVVIDPLRSALGGEMNERQPDTPGRVKEVVDTLRRELQCSVLIPHHSTKDGSTYGGVNDFQGDVDAMFSVTKRGETKAELVQTDGRHAATVKPIKLARRIVGNSMILEPMAAADKPEAPRETPIEKHLSELEPGEYSLRQAARLISTAVKSKPETLRKKVRDSKFFADGKIVIPAKEMEE